MCIYLKKDPAKFIPIRSETTEQLGFFEKRRRNKKIWDQLLMEKAWKFVNRKFDSSELQILPSDRLHGGRSAPPTLENRGTRDWHLYS